MPKLAANLKFLFNEVDVLDRFAAAAQAGFTAVEFQSPYELELSVIKQKLTENRLRFVLLNLPAGDQSAGGRGIACHPERIAEFEAGVDTTIEYATALDCQQANCLAGISPPGLDPRVARATFIRNLKYAAPRFAAAGIRLLIEAINTRDIPGFFLTNTLQSLDIIDAVDSDNLFLQYDIYHMQIMQGDIAPTIARYLTKIAHMQVADTPGRHEPGSGEINYTFLFDFIDRIGYTGWIGCEYQPAVTTQAGLAWAAPYLHPDTP